MGGCVFSPVVMMFGGGILKDVSGRQIWGCNVDASFDIMWYESIPVKGDDDDDDSSPREEQGETVRVKPLWTSSSWIGVVGVKFWVSTELDIGWFLCGMEIFIFRFLSAAFLHFCNCVSSSGCPRRKAGCAYISVSGPFRILVKPYF